MYRFRDKYTAILKYFSSSQTIRSFNDQLQKFLNSLRTKNYDNVKNGNKIQVIL